MHFMNQAEQKQQLTFSILKQKLNKGRNNDDADNDRNNDHENNDNDHTNDNDHDNNDKDHDNDNDNNEQLVSCLI